MKEEKWLIVTPTSFDKPGRERARILTEFLELFGFQCMLCEHFGGVEVSKGVREGLEKAFIVIAILSRDVQLQDGTWRASEWVIQEISWARARGKDCLILLEKGVQFTQGILGDVEHIPFDGDSFSDALIPLGKQVRALLERHLLTTGIKQLSIHTHVSGEPLGDECSDEVKLLILEIRHLAKQQRYEEALELALRATRIDPHCWRAWTSLGALLVQLRKVDAGDKIFEQVLKDFPKNSKGLATALHNRAWVQEIKSTHSEADLIEESALYEQALSLDPSRVNTRACLLICRLLLEETEKAESLLKESELHEGFLDALRYELDVRGTRAHKALQALPERIKQLMYPDRLCVAGGMDY